ncbi:MAG TPA: aminopeptidase [Bacteroidales bacterium]|nr:aminopeptidase [Bacteroidales bacterium]
MKTRCGFLFVIFLFGFLGALCGQSAKDKNPVYDYEGLAQKIVNQCAAVRENDIVMITGGVKNMELLEDIAVNVSKKGGYPLITVWSDRATSRYLSEVPAKYDARNPKLGLNLYGFVDVVINVSYSESNDLYADVPPERIAAMNNANKPVSDLYVKRNIRGVNLGNGLYPTTAQAKEFNISIEQLSEIFWNGVNVDYTKLESTGKAVSKLFAAGKEVQITNPNGTEIKVGIENRKVLVSDGITSPEDLTAGSATLQIYLPAGEVYMSVVPGTAEGKVVVDHYFFEGKDIPGLTLVFKAGKLVSMTSKSGLEPLKAYYDASAEGKEDFSSVDIGINPNVKMIPGSNFVSWVISGMVTITHGNNEWAGGENNCPFGNSYFLPGSTLKIDGKVLIEDGVSKF